MARGDVISDAYTAVTGVGGADVQPATGVEWLITALMGQQGATNAWSVRGKDSVPNTMTAPNLPPQGGNTASTDDARLGADGYSNVKIPVSNSQFIRFGADVASIAYQFAFFGIQTK